MKKLNKGTAIALSIILGIMLVVGFVLSFVPITIGSKTFVSFYGSLNISSDITGGVYGEYNIITENPSKSDLVNSMSKIKDVFDENGYKNVNIYAVGDSKIRVETSFPRGSKTYSEVYSELAGVASGSFKLASAQEIADDTIVVEGYKHVKEIKVYTNNDAKYISIVFNDAGQEVYKSLCQKTTTVYLHLGTYNQSIEASNVTDYSAFTLSDDDYTNLRELEQKIKLGCMSIELDSNTTRINTMSASLSSGESASSFEHKSFSSSTAFVVAISALLVVAVIGIAAFAIRFGLYAILMLATLLFNVYLFIALMCLMPSIEFGLSAIITFVLGISIIYTYAFAFANRVKFEYEEGKSFNASLETAYKKSLPNFLLSNISLFFVSLIFFAFSFGELTSVSIVLAVSVFLSLLTNLLTVPLFIKISISFGSSPSRLFMLKKRSISIDDDEAFESEKEGD